MITFSQPVSADTPAQHVVALTYHQRVKGRLRISTNEGIDAGIVTERGKALQHGEKLADGNGQVLEIQASAEPVSTAITDCPLLFAKACYHVGNRHAEVQIGVRQLVYLRDHVMDSMLKQLGLIVREQTLPFSPENGAYSHGHSHAHEDHHEH